MVKKATGKNYTSKGQRPNVSKGIRKATRRSYTNSIQQFINKLTAAANDKVAYETVPNPNPNETNKRFIRQKLPTSRDRKSDKT